MIYRKKCRKRTEDHPSQEVDLEEVGEEKVQSFHYNEVAGDTFVEKSGIHVLSPDKFETKPSGFNLVNAAEKELEPNTESVHLGDNIEAPATQIGFYPNK